MSVCFAFENPSRELESATMGIDEMVMALSVFILCHDSGHPLYLLQSGYL